MGLLKDITALGTKYMRVRWDNSRPIYRQVLRLQKFTPQLRFIDHIVSPGGRVGSPVMEPFRILGRCLGWKICYDEHKFKFKILAGKTGPKLNARLLFEYSKNFIGQTVPGAMRGEGRVLMGRRGQNEVTTAIIGGQVRTTHDDENMTMTNDAEPGHFFSGGNLKIEFVDENDGNTYAIFTGGGFNNFSTINQGFGSWVFPNMGRANLEAYRELNNFPPIKHTVEDITG
jgi:hypothetical protein